MRTIWEICTFIRDCCCIEEKKKKTYGLVRFAGLAEACGRRVDLLDHAG